MFDWRMVKSDDRRLPIVQRETNPSSYQSLGHPWGHGACWTFLGSVEGKILSGNHWLFVFPCFDPKNIGFCCKCSLKPIRGFFSKLGASWNHSLSHGWSWSSLSPWEMKRGPSLILRDTHTKLVIMWYVPSVSVINPKLHFSIPIHKSYSCHIFLNILSYSCHISVSLFKTSNKHISGHFGKLLKSYLPHFCRSM